MKETDQTIAQIFSKRVAENGGKTLFIYHIEGDFPPYKYEGKFRKMSWNEAGEMVINAGLGLLSLGARKCDRISIMSMTRLEWVIADLALLSIGGETGSIYPNNLPDQACYILNDLESKFVFVEHKWQRKGLLKLKESMPQLKKIITFEADAGDDPLCMTFTDLLSLGRSAGSVLRRTYEENLAAGRLSDVASYIYTSGTTGIPKGAVHSHESLTYTVHTGASWLPIEAGMTDLSFLPMAHIFEQFAGPLLDIYRGDVKIAFARSMDTIARDFVQVRPHYARSAPRFFEKVYSKVFSKVEMLADMVEDDFRHAVDVSRRVVVDGGLYGKAVPDEDRKRHDVFDKNSYHDIRELVLGGNMKFFVAGGAPFSREINEFFWSIGLPIYELYGMTETGGATTNRPGHTRLGSVGKSWPGSSWPGKSGQTKLSPEGELIMKGPNVMLRYHNKPESTAESLKDGWMYSGDIAKRDEDGFFRITDRIKDILITAGGKNVAPVKIEGKVKEDPLISQVVVFGDRKKYLTALITLDEEGLEEKARDLGLKGDYKELSQLPEIRAAVEEIIESKNSGLARYETIKYFHVLDHDLSIESGDLTPTMKVKRKVITEKYGPLIDKLYS